MKSAPRCPDCGVATGAMHEDLCCVACCSQTGLQRRDCGHSGSACGTAWTGYRPGEFECAEWGWYSVLRAGDGYVRVSEGEPGACLDLNRLHEDALWSPERARWVRVDQGC